MKVKFQQVVLIYLAFTIHLTGVFAAPQKESRLPIVKTGSVLLFEALLKTEKVDLEFTEDGINTIAHIASEVNSSVENIGARRLHTIIEKVLDDVSFTASDKAGQTIKVNKEFVSKNLGDLVKNTDLSKFIL